MPDLFIRGAGTYTAHINADNPIGTMQSYPVGHMPLVLMREKVMRPDEPAACVINLQPSITSAWRRTGVESEADTKQAFSAFSMILSACV